MGKQSNASVAGYYDAYSGAEDEPHFILDAELSSLLFDGTPADAECLDVGCGPASSYAPELVRQCRSYVGVDVSSTAVDAARAAGFEALVVEDAGELPFEDESFDLAVCIEVLEHLFAPEQAATEIHRVLRPGGRLVASTPNIAYWRQRLNALRGTWNPLGDDLSIKQPWRDPHIRFFSPKTLERMLLSAGFRQVEVGSHGGRGLDHLSHRHTEFGQSRVWRHAERRFPSLFGLTIHAAAFK